MGKSLRYESEWKLRLICIFCHRFHHSFCCALLCCTMCMIRFFCSLFRFISFLSLPVYLCVKSLVAVGYRTFIQILCEGTRERNSVLRGGFLSSSLSSLFFSQKYHSIRPGTYLSLAMAKTKIAKMYTLQFALFDGTFSLAFATIPISSSCCSVHCAISFCFVCGIRYLF